MPGFDKDDYLKDLPDPDDAWFQSFDGAHASDAGFGGPSDGSDSNAEVGPEHAKAGETGKKAGETMSSEESNNKDDEAKRTAQGAAASAADGNNAGASQSSSQNDASKTSGQAANGAADNGSDTGDKASNNGEGNKLTPLGQAKKEAADYLDALQRERAEFVNFRNRSKKEQEIFRQHGIIDVLTALLPALDDIDRIREHSEMDDSFNAVATKIDKAFEKFGVEKFGEKGETFDPTKHEAILHKPDANATEETVDTVVEAGYRIGDRVIRAARVVVASPQA